MGSTRTLMATKTLRPMSFGTSTRAERQTAFEEWVSYVLDWRLIDPTPPAARRSGEHYTAEFLRDAYLRGYMRAGVLLRQAGYETDDRDPSEIFDDSAHDAALQSVRVQTYHDVEVAATALQTELVRTLESRLRSNPGVRSLADDLTERVETVGEQRTGLIALTRAVSAANHAAIVRYLQAGVDRASAVIEQSANAEDNSVPQNGTLTTADDGRVCSDCLDLATGSYSISDIYAGDAPMPPDDTHPACRCLISPG